MIGSTILIRSPQPVVIFAKVESRSPYILAPIILFQHNYCTLVIILFRPFTRLFINLTVCIRAHFNHSWSCRTNILEGVFSFHRTSCCKFLWGNPCKTNDTFYHWDFFLWDFGFSTLFSHSAAWKNSKTCSTVSFFHACWYRGGNCNCLLWNTAPVELPLPTISKNSLYTLFCSLILDHGVSFIISISGANILISYVLLYTSFHHLLNLW